MSYYRKHRSYSGRSRSRSGTGQLITGILVVFLVISLVPLLFSLGSSGNTGATEPSGAVTDPPVDPTDPSVPLLEEGYLLYQLDTAGNKTYLNIRDTSTGGSFKRDSADACLYRWDQDYCTLFVADESVNRFLSVAADGSSENFKTYEASDKYLFAKLMYLGTWAESVEEGKPYYIAVDTSSGILYYSGSADGGVFAGSNSLDLAAAVYVEYITREVVG